MTRRKALAGLLASAGLLEGQAKPDKIKEKPEPEKPKLPVVCVSSTALAGVGYAELGDIVKQLGFDGVDITVMPGGLVEPQLAPVDEVRAFESLHGAGLQAPIITTALATPYDPWFRTVLALAGRTGVGLATLGLNRGNLSVQTKRDLFALATAGREYKISVLVRAGANEPELDVPRAQTLLSGMDPQWVGINLNCNVFAERRESPDAAHYVSQDVWQSVKAVSLADAVTREPRPLGKGTTDFARLFSEMANAGFDGPVTVHRSYKTSDGPGALTRDCEFVRKQIQTAYATSKT